MTLFPTRLWQNVYYGQTVRCSGIYWVGGQCFEITFIVSKKVLFFALFKHENYNLNMGSNKSILICLTYVQFWQPSLKWEFFTKYSQHYSTTPKKWKHSDPLKYLKQFHSKTISNDGSFHWSLLTKSKCIPIISNI